jgi:hypothetical protein
VVTHDFARWDHEMAWMALYFSTAVWASLGLAAFGLVRHRLALYRTGAAAMPVTQPVALPAPLSHASPAFATTESARRRRSSPLRAVAK